MNHVNTALDTLNTFSVPCRANNYIVINTRESLLAFSKQFQISLHDHNFYLLGDGSNTLFVHDTVNLVIKSALMGIEFLENNNEHIVKVAAGQNWHQLVLLCLRKNIFGLENLALIPGSVGAAPVQNIGAYGRELSDFCYEVEWFNFSSQKFEVLSNETCSFGYRDSIFKNQLRNKGMITSVTFKFSKQWSPQIEYQGLSELSPNTTAQEIMEKVIFLRQSKLPDPDLLPNAGSFFKNPVVTLPVYKEMQKIYESLPAYPQENGEIKLAAGWLIEKSGFKGKKLNTATVHEKQALVLVNEKNGSGANIVALAKLITESVYKKFEIELEPEVRFINTNGECDAMNYIHQFS